MARGPAGELVVPGDLAGRLAPAARYRVAYVEILGALVIVPSDGHGDAPDPGEPWAPPVAKDEPLPPEALALLQAWATGGRASPAPAEAADPAQTARRRRPKRPPT